MTQLNVKGAACSDKAVENDHLIVRSLSAQQRRFFSR